MRPAFLIKGECMVSVTNLYLCRMYLISKLKHQATPNELAEFQEFMAALKQIPQDLGRLLYLKYFTMGGYRPRYLGHPRSHHRKLPLGIRRNWCVKCGTHPEMAKILGITRQEVSFFEKQAVKALAETLLEMRLANAQTEAMEV